MFKSIFGYDNKSKKAVIYGDNLADTVSEFYKQFPQYKIESAWCVTIFAY
jgi:hypothetical protein